jgi:4-hydroxythreonine-4-phosphate dehydrogenase
MSGIRLGIALGDVTGIGAEVTLKALAAHRAADLKYLILGDRERLEKLNATLGLGLPLQRADRNSDAAFQVYDPLPEPLPADLPPGAAPAAQAALAYLRAGATRCLAGDLDGLVTAPVNKEAIIRSGELAFTGQTEFLSDLAGAGSRTAMMLLGEDDQGRWLRVALVTTHLPIKAVAQAITGPKVELAIDLAALACRQLELKRARIGVCGLNPHAGEGGKIGTEEIEVIAPAVKSAATRGINVVGPLAADTLFHYAFKGEFDVVVAMYHDQGLAPLKMIGFERGINWTVGLPFIRTSPDHGTAYDIAGSGKADPSSMMAALRLAKELAARRMQAANGVKQQRAAGEQNNFA